MDLVVTFASQQRGSDLNGTVTEVSKIQPWIKTITSHQVHIPQVPILLGKKYLIFLVLMSSAFEFLDACGDGQGGLT